MKQPNPIVSSMIIAEKVSHKPGIIRKSAMDTVAALLGNSSYVFEAIRVFTHFSSNL